MSREGGGDWGWGKKTFFNCAELAVLQKRNHQAVVELGIPAL